MRRDVWSTFTGQNATTRARWLHDSFGRLRDDRASLTHAIDTLTKQYDTEMAISNANVDNFLLIVNAIVIFLVQVKRGHRTLVRAVG